MSDLSLDIKRYIGGYIDQSITFFGLITKSDLNGNLKSFKKLWEEIINPIVLENIQSFNRIPESIRRKITTIENLQKKAQGEGKNNNYLKTQKEIIKLREYIVKFLIKFLHNHYPPVLQMIPFLISFYEKPAGGCIQYLLSGIPDPFHKSNPRQSKFQLYFLKLPRQ